MVIVMTHDTVSRAVNLFALLANMGDAWRIPLQVVVVRTFRRDACLGPCYQRLDYAVACKLRAELQLGVLCSAIDVSLIYEVYEVRSSC